LTTKRPSWLLIQDLPPHPRRELGCLLLPSLKVSCLEPPVFFRNRIVAVFRMKFLPLISLLVGGWRVMLFFLYPFLFSFFFCTQEHIRAGAELGTLLSTPVPSPLNVVYRVQPRRRPKRTLLSFSRVISLLLSFPEIWSKSRVLNCDSPAMSLPSPRPSGSAESPGEGEYVFSSFSRKFPKSF